MWLYYIQKLQLEIATELDKLSAKLDDVDEMISSAMAADPQVKSLLSSTADVWMPVITATSDERLNFTASVGDDNQEEEMSIQFLQFSFANYINFYLLSRKISVVDPFYVIGNM